MARELYGYASGELALVAGTRKCGVGIQMPGGVYIRALFKKYGFSANGNVAAGKGIYWRLCSAAQDLGAGGTSVNPGVRSAQAIAQANGGGHNQLQVQPNVIAKHSFTLPTTNVRIIREGELHNNAGYIESCWPRGEEPDLVGTGICYWIDFLLPTAETVCSVTSWFEVEE